MLLSVSVRASDKNIEQVCETQYSECLQLLPEAFRQHQAFTFNWFRLKRFQLDAFFHLTEFKRLQDEIELLFLLDKVPTSLELKANVYYAKLLAYRNDIKASQVYQQKAKTLFQQLLDSEQDLDTLIDYGNLHIYMGEFQQGIDILSELAERFKNHQNATAKAKIHMHLGNLYAQQEKLALSRESFKLSKENAEIAQMPYLALTAEFNLARVEQLLGNDQQALVQFKALMPKFKQVNNPKTQNVSYFRMAQLYGKMNQWSLVKSMLDKTNSELLGPHIMPSYQTLLNQSNLNNP